MNNITKLENIPTTECLDLREFENIDEFIEIVKTTTQNFDWLEFYNSGKNLNALIVITPQQTIILCPIYRHAYGMDKLYNILYGLNISSGDQYDEITNNITIRLVSGESVQIQSFFPEVVTEYQKAVVDGLISELSSIYDQIVYYNPFDQVIFKETYEDTLDKQSKVKVVGNLTRAILKDNIILGSEIYERKK